MQTNFSLFLALSGFCLGLSSAFSMSMSSKTIYDIPNSGWAAPQWNWGYASGTGHDCAAICRKKYTTRQAKSSLVQELLDAPSIPPRDRKPKNFEEVKLILALAWQRGRWDGSDGGRGGYGDVLAMMSDASRYEGGDEDEASRLLIEDMQDRFSLLDPSEEQLSTMQRLFDDLEPDTDAARRCCCALVLDAMGFVENGL